MQCHHHPVCPGCPLLEEPPAQQLAIKRGRVQRALNRYPHLELGRVPEVIPAVRDEGYRHRLKLPLEVGKDHARIGLYDPRTHRVLDTPDCPVLAPRLRGALQGILARLPGKTGLHSLDLRVSDATGDIQAVFACEGASLHGGRRFAEALIRDLEGLTSVAVSLADPHGKRVMGRKPTVIAGAPFVEEAIGDTRYRLLPGAFFQTDPQNAVQLHQLVREAVGDAKSVLDLYAGVGAYALALAPGRERVVAVEEVPQAAAAARAVAPDHVEVITGRVEQLHLKERFDVVVLNPARRGSSPHVLERLPKLAQRVVYVSCGPETLARDLDVLAAHGLRVESLQPIDLFPHTNEIETVVHLKPGRALRTWKSGHGRAGSPWGGKPSGAVGRAHTVLALVLGDVGYGGAIHGGTYERIQTVAGHSLIVLQLEAPVHVALSSLAKRGHPTAGFDRKTAGFFASKAGLLRPFVHVLIANDTFAPIHGDLSEALVALGGDPTPFLKPPRR